MPAYRTLTAIVVSAFAVSLGCSSKEMNPSDDNQLVLDPLTDRNATTLTVNLHRNLWNLMDKGTMFGAQIPTLYGLDGGSR